MDRKNASIALIALFLASCTVGPDYKAPEQKVSSDWTKTTAALDAPERSRLTTAPADVARWWSSFHDTELDALIGRALGGNLDLEIAAARVRQARADRAVAAGGQYPTLDVSASYTHQRLSGEGPIPPFVKREFNFYQPGFDASWEADLFGGIRRKVEAADADLAASVESARDVQVTLVAEVARTYVELRGLQRRRAIARENLAAQRDVLALTKERFRTGFVTQLDVSRQSALVAASEADLPVLEADLAAARHALAVLVGEEPGALSKELEADGAIPPVPPEVPIGVPADLLRRRPDLRRAERELAAATARIGEATAELYPRLSITGNIGLQAASGGGLAHPAKTLVDSVGPTLSWPIFAGGSIQANVDARTQVQEQFLISYRRALLVALKEVQDAIVRYGSAQERRDSLARAVKDDRLSVELATDQYKQGLVDFVTVLDTQRELLSAQDALARSEQETSTTLVALYKALGGGWEESAPESK
jgi:NodT family efflux transporter outer membrane factor (OMF) lipoprotein